MGRWQSYKKRRWRPPCQHLAPNLAGRDPRMAASSQDQVGFSGYGLYQFTIRREPNGVELWAWALEWNQNVRLVGIFGSTAEVIAAIERLPRPATKTMVASDKTILRCGAESPLPSDEDFLFDANRASEETQG